MTDLAPPPLGLCICGYPSWLADDQGRPMHPCCAINGPDCEGCRISRDRRRKLGETIERRIA